MRFSEELLQWYAANKRQLPWRNTREPYNIWLSEVILQQTRVAQGLPYYLKFLEQFPTLRHLAEASEKKVLKLWQGLGYYSRARNLHHTAQIIHGEMNGKFPHSYQGLLELKGVGDYTASAIASICYNQAEPVVDGNVYRVLARYFGVDLPVNSTVGRNYFKKLARELIDARQPGEYNQAIMEFGAIQCVPSNPDCPSCPLNHSCVALQKQCVGELPVKIRKSKIRKRFFNYLVPIDIEQKTLLNQRQAPGIWQNMYEFPLLESEAGLDVHGIRQHLPSLLEAGEEPEVTAVNEEAVVYKLSHQHLHARFWIVRIQRRLEGGITIEDLDGYPVPVLIADFIKTLKNSYF